MDADSHHRGLALERFRDYLLTLARPRMGRRFQAKLDASDVVQQTLLEAHAKQAQFRGTSDAQLAAWLRRLLACTLADAMRGLGRAKRDAAMERSIEAALDQSSVCLGRWLAAEQSSPSHEAERNEQELRLAAALETLPAAQRDALMLRHCEGWPLEQICEQLGRSPTAVAGLIKRGNKQLRNLLEDRE